MDLMSYLQQLLPFLETESKGKPQSVVRKEIDENWDFWRPVAEGMISLTEAYQMSPYQLQLANEALNKLIKQKNDANKVK